MIGKESNKRILSDWFYAALQTCRKCGRCAPSKARRFLSGESPDAVKPSQHRLPSIALKSAKSSKSRGRHRVTNEELRSIKTIPKNGETISTKRIQGN